MRHTLHIATVTVLALLMGGCGELENAPFRVGTVHGQLTEVDASVALVAVVGAPELRSDVAPDGRFTLANVPAGAAELYIIATASRTLRVPLTVPSGQSVSLGELVPQEASFLDAHVMSPDKQSVAQAQLTVVGTPLRGLPMEDDGRLQVGPMPDGCYTVTITLPGFPEVSTETCVSAGQTKNVNLNLPKPDGNSGYRGCAVTGCEAGLQCTQDGRCVECLEDEHCGPSLSCRGFLCVGESPLCAPCTGNWQCRSGATCQELPEGGTACVKQCRESNDCEDGLTCQDNRCLPDAAQFSSCQAYRQVGTACNGDQDCRDLGLTNGQCVSEACTYRCAADEECPASFSCESGTGGRVCRLGP